MKKQGKGFKFINECVNKNVSHCILWPYGKSGNRYGAISINGKTIGAHAYILTLIKGERTKEKPYALHSCRNKHCVNPAHLTWGSPQDNANDRLRDGTNRIGEDNPTSKVSSKDVISIRKDGRRQVEIALQYGIDQTTVSDIKRRKIWRHIS